MASPHRFPGFTVLTTPYKKVNGHEILAGVIIPDNIVPGKRPIIARFHGGFLVGFDQDGFSKFAGHDLTNWILQFTGGYALWLQPWLLEYAKIHSAIIVAADYRLMPEHNGMDMMEDLNDFWAWVFGPLQDYLGDKVEVDLDKILIKGDSAGGYLAIQSALMLESKAKALISVYPPIDLKIPFFTTAFKRTMAGFPMYPEDTIDKYLASLKGDEVVSTAEPPSRLDLGFSAIQQGRFVELLGSDTSLFPMEQVARAKVLPSLMILHGEDDSAVPYASSKAFIDKVKDLHPNVQVHYKVVPGCEHGLDAKETLETPWLKEGLEFITPLWLSG